MKLALLPLVVTAGLSVSTLSIAETSTFQLCNSSGCHANAGGSQTVSSSYAKTKYPLVFANGAAGFSSIGEFNYWYGIPQNLTTNGGNVFITHEASLDSSENRGEQLLDQVQQILAITGDSKVNLIGHSHGSQSIRYVAGVIPDQVASVTGVAGPNLGSPVADNIYTLLKTPVLGRIVSTVVSTAMDSFFTLINVSAGQYYSQDTQASLYALTSTGAAEFNKKFPQGIPTTKCGQGAAMVNGIRYYSWSGTGKLTNPLNPATPLLTATGLLISEPSDGLVPKCSSHLGMVIRDNYFQNHLDEVNQVAGLVSPFEVSPVTLYRQHANRLKVAGL